jgi:multidrug efflux pump subunit AcrA (membrane-fusion protein)
MKVPHPERRRRRILVAALVASALGSAWRMHHDTRAYADLYHQWVGSPAADSTDRAPAHTAPRRIVAEARLVARPGAEVTVGAEITGRLLRLHVNEKDTVHLGDLIAELDADEHRAALAEAEARLAEIDADIPLFESRLARATKLAPTGGVTTDEFEQRQRDLTAARIRRKAAAAAVDRLQAVVRKCEIRAPIDGTITARAANPGQTIEPGGRIVTIANLAQTWIEAEVNEFDAPYAHPGAPATITAEGQPNQTWRARVEEIPDTIVLRQLRPQDPGRPSDTGVLLVKLLPQEPVPFKLNQRLEITIESQPQPATPVATVRE